MATSSCASETAALAALVRASGPVSIVAGVTPLATALASGLARAFDAPLAVVLVQGLTGMDGRRPWGAVDEEGGYVVDYFSVAGLRLDEREMTATRGRAVAGLRETRGSCAGESLLGFLPAERVVLVQGGLVQGLLMDAAVSQALRHGAEQVVVATPWSTERAASRFTTRENVTFLCPRVLPAPPLDDPRPAARLLTGW